MTGTDERWVLTAEEQRALDDRAVAAGVAEDELMESAGTNAAEWIDRRLRPRRPVVLVGPGGNGGDGLVVARRLLQSGADVSTFTIVPIEDASHGTRRMADRLVSAGGTIHSAAGAVFESALDRTDCIIDGLFGSGVSRPLAGDPLRVVERVNAVGVTRVSLDLPSGLPSDRGELLGAAVRADVTLAMAFLKPAHLLYPAAGWCGNTAVVDVSYPEAILRTAAPWAKVCEQAAIERRLPVRRPDGHKGSFGRVLVVAGSIGMTGAAMLCCRGALRAGAGLIHLAIPASLDAIVEAALPEAITIPLPDESGHIRGIDDDRFDDALKRADVLAIGPGLSRAPETMNAVRELLGRFDGPVVVDADGLHALGRDSDVLRRLADRAIVTPHPGELGEMIGAPPTAVDGARRDRAAAFATEHRVVLVLKGRPTAIGLPDGDVYLNPTGDDGLATGGSGDVLTGLIAGFIAGGALLADAAVSGAYVHGLAAEAFTRDRAPRALTPSDLLDLLPVVLQEVERCG